MSDYIFKHVTDKIIEQLQNGNVVWKQPWANNGPPMNLISKRPYNGINLLLLAMAGYASPYWLTEKAVVKLRGKIKSNESPHEVFFWRIQRSEISTDKSEGEQQKARSNIFYKTFQLYNIEQCEGLEYKIPSYVKHAFSPIKACETIVKNMPMCPIVEEKFPGAYYMPIFDLINMPPKILFEKTAEYYATLFHEIVHSTGHKKRLGRHGKMRDVFESQHHAYSQEELVAEIGAGFLCAFSGIENKILENTSTYIKSWLRCFKRKRRIFFFAAAQAQMAVNYILGR